MNCCNCSSDIFETVDKTCLLCIRKFLKGNNIRDVKNDHGETLIHLASKKDFADCVKILFENGSSINIQDNNGDTPLHVACSNSSLNCISKLLDYGADTDVKNHEGKTPISCIQCKLLRNKVLTMIDIVKEPLIKQPDFF